jgi:hypothetical protein
MYLFVSHVLSIYLFSSFTSSYYSFLPSLRLHHLYLPFFRSRSTIFFSFNDGSAPSVSNSRKPLFLTVLTYSSLNVAASQWVIALNDCGRKRLGPFRGILHIAKTQMIIQIRAFQSVQHDKRSVHQLYAQNFLKGPTEALLTYECNFTTQSSPTFWPIMWPSSEWW